MNLAVEQVLTQIIAFLAMLWILKRFAWRPLFDIMGERRRKIQSEFDAIEEQKKEIQQLSDAYNQKLGEIDAAARATLQEATAKGYQIAEEIERETRERAALALKKIQSEAEAEIAEAEKRLKKDLIEMVVSATEKIIGEKLDPQKDRKIVEQAIEDARLK